MPLLSSEQKSPQSATMRSNQVQFLKPEKEDSGRVLIVEDEAELSEILEFNLINQGFEVLTAADGLEACRIIGREKPDLILLDLLLPLLNGWEICRMVRSHHDLAVARTPIIMLSALGSGDDRLKGYQLGADLYLAKPYNVKEVVIKSRHLVAQHHQFLGLVDKLASLRQWAEQQDQWQHALFHELRNQLTVISGMAQQLRNRTDLLSPRSEKFAEQISCSSDYLGSLAENYLLVRKVEGQPGRLESESIILKELLDELWALFKPLAEQSPCQLEFDCPIGFIVTVHPVA